MVTCFECDNDRSKIDDRLLNSPINRFRFGSRFSALDNIVLCMAVSFLVQTANSTVQQLQHIASCIQAGWIHLTFLSDTIDPFFLQAFKFTIWVWAMSSMLHFEHNL